MVQYVKQLHSRNCYANRQLVCALTLNRERMLKQNLNSVGRETFNISEKYLSEALVKFLLSCSFPCACMLY